jgi:cytochrome P450
MQTDVRVDLCSAASYAQGHPLEQYARIRESDGLYWHEEPAGPGFWAVGRHADTKAVSLATESFTSWQGPFMWDIDETVLAQLRGFMLLWDPPMHTDYRRLVAPAFTPKRALTHQANVEQLVETLIDGVRDRDEFDLVADLVGYLPLFFIADVLGFPRTDALTLYQHMRVAAASPEAVTETQRSDSLTALAGYGMELGARKRRTAGDDLSSVLVRAEVDGQTLSEEAFAAFFLLLVDAGADTTRGALGAGLIALMAHRDQWRGLQQDPGTRLAPAVEELLRWTSPVVHMRRTATRDVEIGGTLIQPGQKAVLFYGAANHDTTVFAEPGTFDITRPKNPHVAFGAAGPHVCIGAHLARLEMREMLRGIVTRLPDLEQCGPAVWDESTYIIGPESVPVRQR